MTLLFKPIVPVLEYVINYDYIVNELCENKAKPELHCNGKCHLTTELANAATDDAPNSSEKKVVSQQYELVYFQEIEVLNFSFHNPNLSLQIDNSYSNNYQHLGTDGTFHPPTV